MHKHLADLAERKAKSPYVAVTGFAGAGFKTPQESLVFGGATAFSPRGPLGLEISAHHVILLNDQPSYTQLAVNLTRMSSRTNPGFASLGAFKRFGGQSVVGTSLQLGWLELRKDGFMAGPQLVFDLPLTTFIAGNLGELWGPKKMLQASAISLIFKFGFRTLPKPLPSDFSIEPLREK